MVLVPVVLKNLLANSAMAPNPTVNILQAPASLFGLVWMSSCRQSVPLFGSIDKDFLYQASTVIVGIALSMNVLTNYALFKRFNAIWDNKANVALFAAFTFPSASTASLVTW